MEEMRKLAESKEAKESHKYFMEHLDEILQNIKKAEEKSKKESKDGTCTKITI